MICSQNNSSREEEYEEYIIEEVLIEEIIPNQQSYNDSITVVDNSFKKSKTSKSKGSKKKNMKILHNKLSSESVLNKHNLNKENLNRIDTCIDQKPPDCTDALNKSIRDENINFSFTHIKTEPLDNINFVYSPEIHENLDLLQNIKTESNDAEVPNNSSSNEQVNLNAVKSEPLEDASSSSDIVESSQNLNHLNIISFEENLIDSSVIKSEPVEEKSNAKPQKARKKENSKSSRQSFKLKRPAEWLSSALIYCQNCNEERSKKSREKNKNCPNCSVPYMYKCARCTRTHKTMQGLQRHFKYRCNDNPIFFNCKYCEVYTTNPRGMVLHMEEIHGEISQKRCFRCKKCGRSYIDKSYKDAHQKKCTQNPIVQCKFCGFRSRCRVNFQSHLRKFHPDQGDPSMNCDHCVFFSDCRSYLINHLNDSHKAIFSLHS